MFLDAHDPMLPRMNGTFESPDDAAPPGARQDATGDLSGRPRGLTPAELAIWEAHAAELTGAHHRIYTARIRSRVEGERLELALERLVERHAELRATFHPGAEGPTRRVRTRADFQLEFVDARRWGTGELDEIVRLTSRQPMDLSASVFRAVLFSRGDAEHVLLLVAHRIAVGAHRLRAILRDLPPLYTGDPLPPLKPPPSGPPPDPSQAAPEPVRVAASGPGRRRVLLPKRSGAEGAPRDLCRLIDEVLATDPARVAIVAGGQSTTRGELDAAANRLARRIRAAGVDPRSCVAVDLPPSVAAATVYLAILRIGATCLPLGAGAPARTVSPSASITVDGAAPAVTRIPPIQLGIDELTARLSAVSAEPLGFQPTPRTTAVIALAHREGRYHGVPLSREASGHLVASLRQRLGIGPEDRVLCAGPLDAARLLLDLFLPLAAGATVFLEDASALDAPVELARTLDGHRITHFRGERAEWAALESIGWAGSPRLRALCGIRGLDPAMSAFLIPRVARLHGLYGDPETTLCCATSAMDSPEGLTLGVPLGRAVLHLLTDRLRPARTRQQGTVFVGGAGVARGYLDDGGEVPELFFPDPFAADGRGLLFRTGDRGRMNADGSIELIRSEAG